MEKIYDLFDDTRLACEVQSTRNPDNLEVIYDKTFNIIDALKGDIEYVLNSTDSTDDTYAYELALKQVLNGLRDIRFEEL